MIKLAIISHGHSVTFEETYKRFLGVFFNCIIEDVLINILGVILIENTPKPRILCVRENPECVCIDACVCACVCDRGISWPYSLVSYIRFFFNILLSN